MLLVGLLGTSKPREGQETDNVARMESERRSLGRLPELRDEGKVLKWKSSDLGELGEGKATLVRLGEEEFFCLAQCGN